MSRFQPFGEFEVDSVFYVWRVRHYASASSPYENVQGVSACVRLRGKCAKELVIDFPVRDYFFRKPSSTTAFEERLRKCIRGAIEIGWKPDSRGKAFRVKVEEVQGVLSK